MTGVHDVQRLSEAELVALVRRVFTPGPADRRLAVLIDLPGEPAADDPAWAARREMARGWAATLLAAAGQLGLERVALVLYAGVGRNNGELPPTAQLCPPDLPLPAHAGELVAGQAVPFEEILAAQRLILAPTQFSATAPLKVAARRLGFRAATMPGFSAAMIPALRLDYGEIACRVGRLARLLDRASAARLRFRLTAAPGETLPAEAALTLDLRYRPAHASTGLLPEPGTAGNLPSGEAYVVPYEGERPGESSRSQGLLPVQLGEELVLFTVEQNRAVAVTGAGPRARAEAELLRREPAYGNLAELGLGVLGDFGVLPCGELLLDEKLGLHVAFGRSEHFGGQVGPAQFHDPAAVVHLDRVYLPQTQPRVQVAELRLLLEGGAELLLIADDRYVLDWSAE